MKLKHAINIKIWQIRHSHINLFVPTFLKILSLSFKHILQHIVINKLLIQNKNDIENNRLYKPLVKKWKIKLKKDPNIHNKICKWNYYLIGLFIWL